MNEKVTFEKYKEILKESGLQVTKTHVSLPPGDTDDIFCMMPALKLQECFDSGMSAIDVFRELASFDRNSIPDNVIASLVNNAQDNLVLRFVGVNRPADIITRNLLDLQYAPAGRVESDGTFYSAMITKDFAKRLHMSTDEIFNRARVRQDWVCLSMMDILREVELSDECQNELPRNFDIPMHIVTNRERAHGAAVLLDTEYLRLLYGQFGDYFILPSSLHEIIVIPMDSLSIEDNSVKELRELVQQVNRTALEVRDRLSDNIYCYTNKGLQIA